MNILPSTREKLQHALTYAGTLPFIAGALLGSKSPSWWHLKQTPTGMLSLYSILILTFLAGSYWGISATSNVSDHTHSGTKSLLILCSNIITLLVWLVFCQFPHRTVLQCSVAGILVLLGLDCWIYRRNLCSKSYFQMRCNATLIVTLSLLITLSR